MKAVVLHEYGPPKNLKYEDFADPQPGEGEVLICVQAVSVNPIDWKMRSGAARERFPVQFPAILGRDVAGIVREVGPGVDGFAAGDHVFALAGSTYAELCVVPAKDLARIPEGLEMTTASTIPLISVTGDQLMRDGARAEKGQTILLTGALGSVGRIALYAAKEIGANVIAGVRRQQIEEAKSIGAVEAIDLGDPRAIDALGLVDAIADTIGGPTATTLISHVKPGGHYGSVVGPPSNAALHPTVQVHPIMSHRDPKTYAHYGEAIRDKKLVIPIDRMMPLAQAAEAHTIGEKGGVGKLILLA